MSNTQAEKIQNMEKNQAESDNLLESFQKIEDISEVEKILEGKGSKKVTEKKKKNQGIKEKTNVESIKLEKEDAVDEKNIISDEEKSNEQNQQKNNAVKSDAGKDEAKIIKEQQKEIIKLEDQLLRTLAEMQNLRQRTQKDVAEARKYGITGFAREMIGVYENLVRAEESVAEADIEKNELLKNIMEGIKLTKNELLKSFEAQQIKTINPIGEKFNHNFHQAVVRIPDSKSKPNTVIQVMQSGYTIKDRLLRPAMVGVSVSDTSSDASTKKEGT